MYEAFATISRAYNVHVQKFRYVTVGFLSSNFILSCDEGEFFLKQYREIYDDTRVHEIHASSLFFAANGIPVIAPLPTNTGETFVRVAENAYALFPFVAGGKNYPEQNCSDAELDSLVRMIARMHDVGERAPADIIHTTLQRRTFAWTIEHSDLLLSKITGDSDFDHAARASILYKRELAQQWPFGEPQLEKFILAHGDLHAGNVFFDEHNEVSHVYDFELTRHMPAANDLVRQMTVVCFNSGSGTHEWRRWNRAVGVYRTARSKFTDEELLSGIREVTRNLATSFWVEEEHYLKGSQRVDKFLTVRDRELREWVMWISSHTAVL